jgi:RHS repeat-associated protein
MTLSSCHSSLSPVFPTDASHPNRFMFTGREYDKETGLYYYRARYYNPQIGRFLQTDPVGYGAGMNMYAYCGNSPAGLCDPFGCEPCKPSDRFYQDTDGSWVMTFTCPLGAFATVPQSDSGAVSGNVAFFFSQAGFFEAWPGWYFGGATIGGSGSDQWVTSTFHTNPMLIGGTEPCRPKLGCVTITPSDVDGGHAGSPINVITIDDVRILNNYVLNAMVRPEFQRIDAITPGVRNFLKVGEHWDSQFNYSGWSTWNWAFRIGGPGAGA